MTLVGVIAAREGGRFLIAKLGMWRVGGKGLRPQLVRRGFLWSVVMEWACLARVGERGKDWTRQAKHTVSHSDPQICHMTPPSPQPRDRPVLLRNTGTSRVAGLSWVLGWHGLKPSNPGSRADYDASGGHNR